MQLPGLRRCLPTLLFLFLSWGLYAQDSHFMYIQTENSKPFYVKLQGKVISSSTAGYVILPKLENKDYQINIGFPKNEFPEEEFQVSINGEDMGFLLKHFAGKHWSLFNMQTLALVQGSHDLPPQAAKKEKENVFTSLLANVVKDSSLLTENTVPTEPKKLPDTVATAKKDLVIKKEIPAWKDSSSEQTPDHDKIIAAVSPEGKKVSPPVKNQENLAGTIVRLMSMYDVDGMEFIYLDIAENDTIRIFLPNGGGVQEQDTAPQDKIIYNPEPAPKEDLTITPTVLDPKEIKEEGNRQQVEKNKERKLRDSLAKQEDMGRIIYNPEEKVTEGKKEKEDKREDKIVVVSVPADATSPNLNADCKNIATKKNFLQLRKEMAAEDTREGMLEVARKNLKGICYSTEQIKNLSYLFLNDEGKYRFFDIAYPHTSDPDKYESLKSQLNDDYYINRFKAMIRK